MLLFLCLKLELHNISIAQYKIHVNSFKFFAYNDSKWLIKKHHGKLREKLKKEGKSLSFSTDIFPVF